MKAREVDECCFRTGSSEVGGEVPNLLPRWSWSECTVFSISVSDLDEKGFTILTRWGMEWFGGEAPGLPSLAVGNSGGPWFLFVVSLPGRLGGGYE